MDNMESNNSDMIKVNQRISENYNKVFYKGQSIRWWSEKDAKSVSVKYGFNETTTTVELNDMDVQNVLENGKIHKMHTDVIKISLLYKGEICESYRRKIHPMIDYEVGFFLKDYDNEYNYVLNLKNVELYYRDVYGQPRHLYIIDKTHKISSLDLFLKTDDDNNVVFWFFYTVLVNNMFEPQKMIVQEKTREEIIKDSYNKLIINPKSGIGFDGKKPTEVASRHEFTALDTTINFWDIPVSYVEKDGSIAKHHADIISFTLLHNNVVCETLNCQIQPKIDFQLEIRFNDSGVEYKNIINLKAFRFFWREAYVTPFYFVDANDKTNSLAIGFNNKVDREYICIFLYTITVNNIFDSKKIERERRVNRTDPLINLIFGGGNGNNINTNNFFSINTSASTTKAITTKATKGNPYDELDSLIGLESIKKDIKELASFVKMQQIRKSKGLEKVPVSLHLVFTGNPGTGKTTIARILAAIYKDIGVLSKGQMIECDRSSLVAGYIGQTALKTQEMINKALGGVLFIDEAYSLANESEMDFGHEAIDTILKAMEDNRDDLVVIVAGYPDLMKNFIESNPGLQSRFNKYINFPDYSEEEMFEIFEGMCKRYDYKLEDDAVTKLKRVINQIEISKDANFANARTIRNIFETVITKQATRLASGEYNDDEMTIIKAEDFE